MRRVSRAALACMLAFYAALFCRQAAAQLVEIEASYTLGDPIVIECAPKKTGGITTTVELEGGEGIKLYRPAGSTDVCVFAARPGVYGLVVRATYEYSGLVENPEFPGDPTKATFQKITVPLPPINETITIVSPTPAPPGPGPQPHPGPGPVIPPDNELARLITDASIRKLLAHFYTDLAAAVRSNTYQNTSMFREGYRGAIKKAQDAGALPTGLSVIDKPISDRIAAAVGLTQRPLDEATVKALSDELDKIAADFGGIE